MRKLVKALVLACALLGCLAACDVAVNVPAPTPCPTRTTNTSPATQTADPVPISTDHAVYAPNDTIHATFVNQLQTPITITTDAAFCPYVEAQLLQDTVWRPVDVCGPPSSGDTPAGPRKLTLPAGQSFVDFIVPSGASDLPHVPFVTGTYRLKLHYNTATLSGYITGDRAGYTEYSASFRVCACGVCA